MENMTQSATLDETIALLQSGLVSIDPEAAIANIEAWQQQVIGTDMAETLGELKLAIDGGVRSGEIGSILSHLGKQAAAAAETQEGDSASKLQQLGELLSNAMQ
ncbi:MAG: hypothetical protein KME10_09775 [Plectolyngbya sp. WJT66-NPBG17]|jgi:hypothetical protein|nr:hypothetical protein [Plectolyngbya sp. WJT66-NPBG17]MBW4525649.1 hypothetical protein [Phormidium tanganyikae FI6-MK23]